MTTRTLHFVWIGDKPVPQGVESWVIHNEFVSMWDENSYKNIDWPLKPQMEIMRKTGQLCGVADLMRYQILHRHGGIALDADSVAQKPIPEWLWDIPNALCHENEIARPGLLALGFMKFQPNHPFLDYLINDIAKYGWSSGLLAWQAVGPQRLTKCYREWVNRTRESDIMILPSALFIPNHFTGLNYTGLGAICKQEWMSTRGL